MDKRFLFWSEPLPTYFVFVLFGLILYVPSTIFLLCRDLSGQVFLGWASTKVGFMFLPKDTTQLRWRGSNPRPLYLELSTLPLSHCAIFIIYHTHVTNFIKHSMSLNQMATTDKIRKQSLTYISLWAPGQIQNNFPQYALNQNCPNSSALLNKKATRGLRRKSLNNIASWENICVKLFWNWIRGSRNSDRNSKRFHTNVITSLFAYCKGGNFNIHIWVCFGYFIC